jgi:hypothetical protein
MRLYGTETDGVYAFSRFVEEVLPNYDALDAAFDAVNGALGPTGFQLELWGDPHTQQTAAIFRGEGGGEYGGCRLRGRPQAGAGRNRRQAHRRHPLHKRRGLATREYAERLFVTLTKLGVPTLVEIHHGDLLKYGGQCYLLKNSEAASC